MFMFLEISMYGLTINITIKCYVLQILGALYCDVTRYFDEVRIKNSQSLENKNCFCFLIEVQERNIARLLLFCKIKRIYKTK